MRAGLMVDDSALLDEQRRQTALAELLARQDAERNEIMRQQAAAANPFYNTDPVRRYRRITGADSHGV